MLVRSAFATDPDSMDGAQQRRAAVRGLQAIAVAGALAVGVPSVNATAAIAHPAVRAAHLAATPGFVVTVTEASATSARVQWTPVQGAVRYLLQYRRVGTSRWVETYYGGDVTSASVGGLNQGNWEFRVFGYSSNGQESVSESVIAGIAIPRVPLKASVVGGIGSAVVSWNPQVGKNQFYVQYRRAGTTAWQEGPYVDGNTTRHTVTGLSAGTWEFRAISYDLQWNPEISPPVTAVITAQSGIPVQQVIDDMDRPNDVNWALAPGDSSNSCTDQDKEWACGPGWVTQNAMFGDAVPDWVRDWLPESQRPLLSSNVVWNEVRPWFVVFPSRKSTSGSTNYSIKLRNYQTYVLRRSTGKWELVQSTETGANNGMWGGIYDANVGGQVADSRLTTDSEGTGFTPASGTNALHGGPTDYHAVGNPGDVVALHTRVTAKLAGPDATNPNLQRLMNVGCDYGIPNNSFKNYPGVGGSRLRLLTSSWQTYSFTTVRTPNASISNPINPARALNFNVADLRRNPPPGVTP